MNRTFLINAIFLISINVLIKPFYIFGIDRVVQNTVGESTYGFYFSIVGFTYLLQIISDFGIQNYNNKNIAQHRKLLGKYFPNILILKFILALLYLAVIFPVAILLQYEWIAFWMIFMVAVNNILIGLSFYMRSNISGLGFYRTDSILSAMDKTLMILICGILLYTPSFRADFKIEWFIYAQTFSLLLTTLTAYWIVRKHLPPIKWRINPVFLRLILKESYPYALVLFLMTVYTKVDSVMIERMLPDGKSEAGIYASGYRLLDAVNMVGFLFAGLLLPMFSRMLKKQESIASLFKLSFLLIWAISIAVSANVWFFKNEIALLLYDNATAYWGMVMGYLLLTFVAVSGTYIVGTLLTAEGRLMKMNRIFVIGILLNITLNYFLIQSDKAAGAAIATVVTQSFVLIAQAILLQRIFKFNISIQIVMRILIYAVLVTFSAYLFYHTQIIDWRGRFVISGGVAILLAILCGMIQPQALRSLKQ